MSALPRFAAAAQTSTLCSARPTGCTTPPRRSSPWCGAAQCGLVRLDPQPPPRRAAPLLSGELLVHSGRELRPAGMEEAYRRLVLRDHVRFVAQRAARLEGARAAARRRLRRRTVSGHAARARVPRGRAGFFARGGGDRVERQQAPAVCADLEARRFARGSWRRITMFHVLEHLYDPRAYFAAARELLAPDGRLIVQVPNAGVAGSSACWAAPGTASTCRAICSISATATWRRCSTRAVSRWCAANIFPCAIIRRGWPAASRHRSIPWPAASRRMPEGRRRARLAQGSASTSSLVAAALLHRVLEAAFGAPAPP